MCSHSLYRVACKAGDTPEDVLAVSHAGLSASARATGPHREFNKYLGAPKTQSDVELRRGCRRIEIKQFLSATSRETLFSGTACLRRFIGLDLHSNLTAWCSSPDPDPPGNWPRKICFETASYRHRPSTLYSQILPASRKVHASTLPRRL